MATTPTPTPRKKPTAVTEDNVEAFLKEFDTIVSDLDGVVWRPLAEVLPGAIEGLHRLRAAGKKILFVTNNSLQPQFEKFRKHGFEVQRDELVHPTVAMARHLQRIGFKKKALVLAVEACKEELRAHGIDVSPYSSGVRVENVPALFAATQDDPDVGAVVMDTDLNISYADLGKAAACLLRPDCLLLTGATELQLDVGHTVVPGPGRFATIVEQLAGRKAISFGKPSPLMVTEYLSEHHKLDMKRCLFVGDTLWQDMGTARACGMKSLLTLSGVTALEELETCDPDLIPDYYVSSLAVFSHLPAKPAL